MTYDPHQDNIKLFEENTINQKYFCFDKIKLEQGGYEETAVDNIYVNDDQYVKNVDGRSVKESYTVDCNGSQKQ